MQAIFVHHLYAPIYVGGQKAIAKLYVTESIEGEHKFYLVKIKTIDYTHEEIEKEATQAKVPTDESVLNPRTNSTAGDASSISIAEIFDFVKRNGGKNRVDTLLMSLRVQFPSGQQAYDSATGSISYNGENVNITKEYL